MDDARKAFVARDEFKAESKELRSLLEAVVGKLDALAKPAAQTPEQTQTPGNPLESKLEQLAGVVQSLVGDKTNEQKTARRKAITDAVVTAAKEDQRELVRGALSTLVLDGAVDIHAENTIAEAEKALARLRAAHPAAFAPASGSSGTSVGGHGQIPEGMPLHEYMKLHPGRMTLDEFQKRRREEKKHGLAV